MGDPEGKSAWSQFPICARSSTWAPVCNSVDVESPVESTSERKGPRSQAFRHTAKCAYVGAFRALDGSPEISLGAPKSAEVPIFTEFLPPRDPPRRLCPDAAPPQPSRPPRRAFPFAVNSFPVRHRPPDAGRTRRSEAISASALRSQPRGRIDHPKIRLRPEVDVASAPRHGPAVPNPQR